MRLAFYALLLANLGWFAWAQWVSSPAVEGGAQGGPRKPVVTQAGSGRIQLIGEGASADPAGSSASTLPGRCVAVGPLPSAAAASAALEFLARHGYAPSPRAGTQFWVEIRVEASLPEAQTLETILREHADLSAAEQAAIGDPAGWRFVPCGSG